MTGQRHRNSSNSSRSRLNGSLRALDLRAEGRESEEKRAGQANSLVQMVAHGETTTNQNGMNSQQKEESIMKTTAEATYRKNVNEDALARLKEIERIRDMWAGYHRWLKQRQRERTGNLATVL